MLPGPEDRPDGKVESRRFNWKRRRLRRGR